MRTMFGIKRHRRVIAAGLAAALGILALLAAVPYAGRAAALTAPWTRAALTCVPDDDTTSSRYDALTSGGRLRFQGVTTGSIYFYCEVENPRDANGENPDWDRMELTYAAPGASVVEARLYRQSRATGATALNKTFTGTADIVTVGGICQVPAFDYNKFAYFVRIELRRGTTSEVPQAFNVTLTSCPVP
jgi:hypothetical protein